MAEKSLLELLAGQPQAFRKLSYSQLGMLSSQIRKKLIETVSETGGHLASNLGVVELTLALLHCFDVPEDKIVWDVGHQCYSYKMLTDRFDSFITLRQQGGISGFPKTAESCYDSFVSGHASTSVAVAHGLKCAMEQRGDRHFVTAVIGDGSFTGGMVYEGLNNVGKSGQKLIIILNDNEMAISKNEGAFAKYLSVIRSTNNYFKVKNTVKKMVLSLPVVGDPLNDFISGSKTMLKQVIYPSTFFEEFGFTYFGPVDGHSIKSLCDVIEQAKLTEGPSIIHIKTIKGKGYHFAEKNPGEFHGVSKFDISTGKPFKLPTENFSEVFGKELTALAAEDKRICAITAAMEHGTGLQHFSRAFKKKGRFYDVGIAEEFGVTFASAMSAADAIPVFAVYSTFLQRAYDQLIHDAAIEKRHIVLGIDRAGIVGDDGETHQGVFDAAFLSTIPNVTLFAPCNFNELRAMLRVCIKTDNGIMAVRYPRGGENTAISGYKYSGNSFDIIDNGGDQLIITYGRTFDAALRATEQVGNTDILKLNRIIPIDDRAVLQAMKYKRIYFAEEGIKNGGIAMQFAAKLMLNGYKGAVSVRAIDGFVAQNTVDNALKLLGLDSDSLAVMLKSAE